ncbi:hypothetical protein BDR26DRAFT_906843 [Obelidium mucronatum]|nr:hypothetical protein BDR26DRAFT_906843 [Obelidium mucronatum]
MEDAYCLAIHARRATLFKDNIQLVIYLRHHYMPSNHSGLHPMCPSYDNLNVSNLTDKFVPTNPNKRKQLITAEKGSEDEDDLDPNNACFLKHKCVSQQCDSNVASVWISVYLTF